MVIDFSKVNCSDRPMLLLKNLDGTTIDVIGFAFNVEADLAYNEISSISFDVPAYADGERVPYYDKVIGMRIVELIGVGQFLLIDPSEENDGIRRVKSCKGYSLEYEFTKKSIYLEPGTYNFFSGIDSSNPDTIIGRIKEIFPDWSFSVDDSLIGKYRTFDETNKKVYDFIKSDVQESYGCIFDFNTANRTVSVVSASSFVDTKQVYLSSESLIKSIQIDEDSDSIVTCLDVNGDDTVNIRSVNPTGTNKIYNLDYFMATEYFTQETIDKWNVWKSDYELARSEYYDITMSYDMSLLNIVMKERELSDLEGELKSLENLQAVIIQGISIGAKSQSDLNLVNVQIQAKKSEISEKGSEISSLKSSASSTLSYLTEINNSLAFEQYFSLSELAALRRYFIEDSIQDSSFVPSVSETYTNEDVSGDLSGSPINISGSTITNTVKGDSTIFSISGGHISVGGISADIVKGTIEMSNTDNSFVLAAYTNSGTIFESSFRSGNITISGISSGTISDISSIYTMVSNGRLYFTKNSTIYEEHQIEWELYDYGKTVLAERASPTYNFTVECANFLSLDDYVLFHNQLTLGKRIYIDINDEILQPYVVSVHIDFENPNNFSIQFSSSYTSFDKSFSLAKLLEQSVSMGKTLSYKNGAYSSFINSGASNSVKEFMDASLDIAKKSVMSSGNQAITYSDTGMRVRKWKDENKDSYDPEEIWIVDNMIAFTDDNWATAKMAIGKIFDPNFTTGYEVTSDSIFIEGKTYYTRIGNSYTEANVTVGDTVPSDTYYEFNAENNTVYGIAAPYLVGTLLAGQNLVIDTENGGFRVDSSGVHVDALKFYITHGGSSSNTTLSEKFESISSEVSTVSDSLDEVLGLIEEGFGGAITTYYQDTEPTAPTEGDIWFDSSAGKLYECHIVDTDGEIEVIWRPMEDSDISNLLSSVSSHEETLSSIINNNGYLKADMLSGVISSMSAKMKSSNGNVLFDSDGIWLMNSTDKSTATKAIWMNESGILFGHGTPALNPSAEGSGWVWTTAIGHDGITADALASKTLSSAVIKGGSISIGGTAQNPKFKVDSNGNLSASSGSFTGSIDATSMKINGASVLTNTDTDGNATSSSKISSNYLDLGNITLNGSTGDITLGGNIYISGNIQWNSSNSPVSVQYSSHGYLWHSSFDSSDYYARYSYDGGITWTSPVKIQGEDGSDASVTRDNIYAALLNNQSDGIYSQNGHIYIKTSYLDSGTINTDLVTLGGSYGGLKCANGLLAADFSTAGAMLYSSYPTDPRTLSEDPFNYFIATNGGVRMNAGVYDAFTGTYPVKQFWLTYNGIFANDSIFTSSDKRFKNSISGDMSSYEEFYMNLKPCFYKMNDGTSGRFHVGFIAQEVEEALIAGGLSTQDFAGIAKCSGEDGSYFSYPDEYSLRYSEFIALNTYMIQNLINRVATLESTIRELKENNK